jgi:hypothetical protein
MYCFPRNSVANVIKHQCVGNPTYLDVLPGDVLQYCIMPFLGWEDRIHVNMLTPVGDRTPPNKIPKERIIANQILVSTQKLKRLAGICADLQILKVSHLSRGSKRGPSRTCIVQAIVNFLSSLLEPHNIVLFQYIPSFRDTAINKIVEFSDPANFATIPRIYLREQMTDIIHKLNELLAKNPFVKFITPQKYLSAPVTQNETAVLNEWWVPGKGVVGRYQGDIYTEME